MTVYITDSCCSFKLAGSIIASVMSAEHGHGHAGNLPIYEELTHELSDVWASFGDIIGVFMFGLFAFLDILPQPQVSHGGGH